MTKSRNVNLDHDDFITSADRRLGDEPDWIRPELEWIEGVHGSAADTQVTGDDVATPVILYSVLELHPDRPTGATAMLDAHGAKYRLKGCRPGSWLISPKTGWKWSVWPNGHVGWLPMDIELPDTLRVGSHIISPEEPEPTVRPRKVARLDPGDRGVEKPSTGGPHGL